MDTLGGHYRHLGATTRWDADGVALERGGRVVRVGWDQVLGVRRLGGKPGFVQLLVVGHVPAQRLAEDPYSIAVRGEADANRLTTTLGWSARGRDLTYDELA